MDPYQDSRVIVCAVLVNAMEFLQLVVICCFGSVSLLTAGGFIGLLCTGLSLYRLFIVLYLV